MRDVRQGVQAGPRAPFVPAALSKWCVLLPLPVLFLSRSEAVAAAHRTVNATGPHPAVLSAPVDPGRHHFRK